MKRRLSIFAVWIFFLSLIGLSQSQTASADIKGTVVDSTGALLRDATITVINIGTGIARESMSDDIGTFRFFLLPPAEYELRVEVEGFSRYVRSMEVSVGEALSLEVVLQPARLEQEVLVKETVASIDAEKTQQSDTIIERQIRDLPINERNFLNFTLLTPGVTDSRAYISFSLPQAPNSGLSFAGQNGRANNVTIDGVDNNDSAVGSVRSTLSQEAVQEFQVNRSTFTAEFGRAGGGLINIVSKSGTNYFHSTLFTFARNEALDARNPFAFGPGNSQIDPPYRRLQSGFSGAGPIKKDRTFYFLSFEGLRQRESRFVTFLDNTEFFHPTQSQQELIRALRANPRLRMQSIGATLDSILTTSAQSYPDTVDLLQSNSGVFPFRNSDNTASLRLDHSVSASNQLFGRITFSDVDTVGGGIGGLKGPSRGANYASQDSAGVFGHSHFFGPRLMNEFRFQLARRHYNVLPADAKGPEITINGLAALGRDFFLPSKRNEQRWQWVDNLTRVSGRHSIKSGLDLHYLPFDTTTEVFLGGRFIFGEGIPLSRIVDSFYGPGASSAVAENLAGAGRGNLVPSLAASITSLQAFNLGLPIVYQQGFGDPHSKLSNKILAGYVQDTLAVRRGLTLNFGLRYDMEFHADPVHRDRNNFAPRFGFSYSPDSRTAIRGGYGVYYSPLIEGIAFLARVLDGRQISQLLVPLTGLPDLGIHATSAQVWNVTRRSTLTPANLASLDLRPGVTPPILLRTDANLVNPYNQQFSLGVDREASGIRLNASYIGNRGVKLIRSRNWNLKQTGMNVFGPVFGPLNPEILQDNRVESSGASIYHGFAVSAAKRYSHYFQFQVSYTLAKAIDDTVDFITDLQPANQLNLRLERSLSAFDQRHRFVISAIADPIWRVTVAPVLTYGSGHPFNLLLGFDANGDTQANTDRPPFAGRNTGAGPDFISFDLRLAREFRASREGNCRLEGIIEAFNLFNRVNFSGVNNVIGTTPLTTYRVHGSRNATPAEALGFTSAFDPRQIQLGLKFKF